MTVPSAGAGLSQNGNVPRHVAAASHPHRVSLVSLSAGQLT
jgi:hypothetical protein